MKGKWNKPATEENIEMLLNVVFGRDDSLFDDKDREDCEKMWKLIESGRGDRMIIVPANLAGFFYEKNIMLGSPMEISKTLFGNDKQRNNINKGKSNDSDNPLRDVKQFLSKYIDKLIRNK